MCVTCQKDNCNCELPKNENVSSNILYDGDNLFCGDDLAVKKNTSITLAFKSLVNWVCRKLRIPVQGIVGGNVVYQPNTYVGQAIINLTQIFNQYLQGGGGVTIVQLIDITHAELVALVNNNTLIQGTFYRITDFKTIYDQPDFDNAKDAITTNPVKQGPVQPLIVLALTNSILSSQGYQEDFPLDVIEYILEYTTPISNTVTKGRIVYRKDDDGNETDYDHRNVFFKRYYDASMDPVGWYDLNEGLGFIDVKTFDPLEIHRNNKILGFFNNMESHNYMFDLPNINFVSESHNNVFSDNSYNIVITGQATDNVFLGNCINTIFHSTSFRRNRFSNIFNNYVRVFNSIQSNEIYELSYNNLSLNNFSENEMVVVYNNTITQGSINGNKIRLFTSNNISGNSLISISNIYRFNNNTVINASISQLNCNAEINNNNISNGGVYLSNIKALVDCTINGSVFGLQSDVTIPSIDFTGATIIYGDFNKHIVQGKDNVDIYLKYFDEYGAEITVTDLTL